ncbi:hypothetical protein [Corynebacterium heidelbergense]|uniref:Uncharacterized protein n=1 Tax=Corynebacterium heidelbergense TaxID=2055947 RepID=A0A364V9G2_9CORY|nr:hypothetical protein [Corynebacterium heidelbergense]RAV33206.1 hypothetical protein CWC39_09675 [Corynebacterium heidelbergense]WCZ36995.1 hypothetical protein CHEID_07310 [Corynebacterium heidelbergense]
MNDPHLADVDRYLDPPLTRYNVDFTGGITVMAPDPETATQTAWDYIHTDPTEYLTAEIEGDE